MRHLDSIHCSHLLAIFYCFKAPAIATIATLGIALLHVLDHVKNESIESIGQRECKAL